MWLCLGSGGLWTEGFPLPGAPKPPWDLPFLLPYDTALGEFKAPPPRPPCTSFSFQGASHGPPILQMFPRGGQEQRLLPAGLAWAFCSRPAASSCAFSEPLQWCLDPGFASSRAVDLM